MKESKRKRYLEKLKAITDERYVLVKDGMSIPIFLQGKTNELLALIARILLDRSDQSSER